MVTLCYDISHLPSCQWLLILYNSTVNSKTSLTCICFFSPLTFTHQAVHKVWVLKIQAKVREALWTLLNYQHTWLGLHLWALSVIATTSHDMSLRCLHKGQMTGHALCVNGLSSICHGFLATGPRSMTLFDLLLINNRDKQPNSSRM